MRISISGSISQGKSTFISDFLKEWPMYKTPSDDYRSLLSSGKHPHSKLCNKEGQWAILNHMVDELQKYDSSDYIIFDRTPLDNLVFSLWAFDKKTSDIDQEFIDKCIPIVRESMRHLDIIFFTPITKTSPVPIVDNGKRETDPEYIKEIDNIFKALTQQYYMALGSTPFFPAEDSPAIIEIFGKPLERIQLAKLYLNVNGDIIGEEGGSILDPNNINELEQLVMEQASEDAKEKYLKKQKDMANEFLQTVNKKKGPNFTKKKK